MPTVQVNDSGGTFNASSFLASANVAGVNGSFASTLEGVAPSLTYFAGSSTNGTSLTAAPSSAGSYTVVASFAGSTDYGSATSSASFTITKPTPMVQVNDGGGTFNNSPFSASVSVAGVIGSFAGSLEGVAPSLTYFAGSSINGTLLTAAPSSAGSYTVVALFAGSTDYSIATSSASFTITKATPVVQVNDSGGTFNALAFSASQSVAGANGSFASTLEGVAPSLTYFAGSSTNGTSLTAAPSSVGSYTVVASFAGSTDYGSATSSASFTITKATAVVQVNDSGGTFNGSSFSVSAIVAGVNGSFASTLEGVAPSLTYFAGSSTNGTSLTAAPSSVGSYIVVASFAGSADYGSATSSASFTITKASPVVQINDSGGTFNASIFSASASVAGVNGSFAGSLEEVVPTLTYFAGTSTNGTSLTAAPSSAGSYTVVASFAGSTDYGSATSSASFTITKPIPMVQVNDGGGTFNNSPFSASASVAGVIGSFAGSLEGVAPSLTYFAGSSTNGTSLTAAPSSVGSYTVVASFAGSTDYGSATSLASFTITKATAVVQVNDSGGTFNASSFSASASVAGVNGSFVGSLEGVAPSLTYFAGSSANGTSLTSAPSSAGSYTVVASFSGSTDYGSATSSASFTITRAMPMVQVNDSGGTFNASSFLASANVAGVNGSFSGSLEGVAPSLTYFAGSSTNGTSLTAAPSSAGSYTVVASFAGSTDYGSATSSASFTITRATPMVQVNDSGGTFNALAFSASQSVAGANGSFASTLEGVAPSLTYFAGTSTNGTSLTAAPSSAGSYTVVASFAGSTDYGSATSSASFTITKATAVVQVNDSGGTFNASSFSASASVAGVNGSFVGSLEGVAPSLTYFAGTSTNGTSLTAAPSSAGSYTVVASFAGSTDYGSATSLASFTITKPIPMVQVNDGGGTFNNSPFSASASVAGVIGSFAGSLEGVAPSLTYFAGSSTNGTSLTAAPSQRRQLHRCRFVRRQHRLWQRNFFVQLHDNQGDANSASQ